MNISIIHAAMFTIMPNGGWGAPLVLESEPGCGKSAIWETYARRCGFPMKVLDSSVGEGAYGVIPMPVKGDDGRYRIVYPAPDYTEEMTEDRGGVVFCDEITSNPPLIQSAQMALVLRKQIGSYTLGSRVRVIGACNPVALASNGYDIAPPLANRLVWLDWTRPTVEEHTSYMLGRANDDLETKIDAKLVEADVLKAWPSAYAQAVALETSFLRAQPDYKNKCPDPSKDGAKGSRAWPSDRSWEMATRCLTSAAIHGLSEDDTHTFIKGCVGSQAAEQFATFRAQNDLPDIAQLLDGKITWKHDRKKLDVTFAVLNGGSALVTADKCENREARVAALWTLLGTVGHDQLDVVVPSVQALTNANLHTGKVPTPILSKVQPAISAMRQAMQGRR